MDIKGPNLVKGIHLEGLRVLGNPEEFAEFYYQQGADELFYQDVVASLYERNSLHEIISATAKRIFIPLTVGGGIRTIQDIKDVLRAGADKVSINTAAIRNPSFIREASLKFGSSTIVVAIEAIRHDGNYEAFVDNGRQETGLDVFEWAITAESLGAGEIVITSVDREGTGAGYDIDLIRKLSEALTIPVIAHGGGGKLSDVKEVIEAGKANAVAIASCLHYDFISKGISVDLPGRKEGNVAFLESGRKSFNNIQSFSVKKLKDYLLSQEISCRP